VWGDLSYGKKGGGTKGSSLIFYLRGGGGVCGKEIADGPGGGIGIRGVPHEGKGGKTLLEEKGGSTF